MTTEFVLDGAMGDLVLRVVLLVAYGFFLSDFAVALRCSNSESNSDCTLEVPGFCIEVTKMDLSTNEQIERRLDCMVKTRANVHFLTVAGGCGYETQIDNQLIKLKCCEEDFCNENIMDPISEKKPEVGLSGFVIAAIVLLITTIPLIAVGLIILAIYMCRWKKEYDILKKKYYSASMSSPYQIL